MARRPAAAPAPDRRIAKTRHALGEALIALILERGYEAITVQDLIDRANVGRSTFYAHFDHKDALLLSNFEALRRHVRASYDGGGRVLGFARGLIEHAHEQRRLFQAIVGRHSGRVVQKHFRQMVLELIREDLAAQPGPATASPRRDAAAAYLAGGFFELMTWWVDTRNALGPAEIEELFLRMSRPVVAMLRAA